MEIVAGINLKSLKPRVWDSNSPYYLPQLKAVMISYADFHKMPKRRQWAMEQGIHQCLDIPKEIKVYLDNGAFYFTNHQGEPPINEYREFVKRAKPDWYPIPQDFIPTPKMGFKEQQSCLKLTMAMNRKHQHGQYIPVIHVCRLLEEYIRQIKNNKKLMAKPAIALGGIVPNLLRLLKHFLTKKS